MTHDPNQVHGFLDDQCARDYEPHEAHYDFLITGRPPAVGQRIQSYVDLPNGAWCRFSGIVTAIGKEPTFEEWRSTCFWTDPQDKEGSLLGFENTECPECVGTEPPACWNCKIFGRNEKVILTLAELQQRCKASMGALNGQTITAYSYPKHYCDPAHLESMAPYVGLARIYKICFQLDDSKANPWVVTSMEDVTDSVPIKDLPQVFKDWDHGRQEGMVAPFHLSPAERKKHACHTQEFLNALKADYEAMGGDEWEDEE